MWWADVLSPANQMLACVGGGPTLSEAAAAHGSTSASGRGGSMGKRAHASLPGSSIWACRVSCRHAGALKFMRHLLQCLEGTKSNDGPAVAALDAGQKGKGTGPSQ